MSKTILTSKFSQAYAKVENKNSYIRSLIDNLIDSGKYSLDDVFDIVKEVTDDNLPKRTPLLDDGLTMLGFPKVPEYALIIYNITYYYKDGSNNKVISGYGHSYSVVKKGEAITPLPNLSGNPDTSTRWYTNAELTVEYNESYNNYHINNVNVISLYCEVEIPAPNPVPAQYTLRIEYGFLYFMNLAFISEHSADAASGTLMGESPTSILLKLSEATVSNDFLKSYIINRKDYEFYGWKYYNAKTNEVKEIKNSSDSIDINNILDKTIYPIYSELQKENKVTQAPILPDTTESINIGDLRDYLHNLIGKAIIPSLDIYERYYFTIDDYILKSNVSYDKKSNKIQNILQANEEYAEGVQAAKVMTGNPVVTSALGKVIYESMYANASKINNTFSNTRALLDAPFLYDTSKPGLFFRDSRNNLLYGFLNNTLNIFTAQKYNSFLNLLESTSETVLEELSDAARNNVKSKISEDWGELGSSIIDYKSIFDSEFNYLPNMGDAITELTSAIKDYMYYVVLRFEIIPSSYLLYETCKKLIIDYGNKIKTNSNSTIESVELSSIEEIYTIEALYLITNFICDAIPSVDTNKYISTSFEDDINKIEECSGKFELLLTKVYEDVPVIRTHYKNIIEKILTDRTEHFNLSDAVKNKFSINTDTN